MKGSKMFYRIQALPSLILAASLFAAPFAMAQTPPPAPMPHQHGGMAENDDGAMLERHIAHMHDALKVTPAQEDQWKPVAQTMRDNEKSIHALIKDKRSKIDSQSAVDDLNAYAEIAAAHAQNSRKMADAFATFYVSLGDDQKKIADDFFREHKKQNERPMHGRKGPEAH
jgi:Spy/CpxP family protein refolding chaperone